jgi:hypothetical protein
MGKTYSLRSYNLGKANREMCVAFADMFGARSEEVMEWAHTFGKDLVANKMNTNKLGGSRASQELLYPFCIGI